MAERKISYLTVDPFPTLKTPSPFTNFFSTYNRTDIQEQVRNLVNVCAVARDFCKADRVILWGLGRAGLWALLAAPAADAVVASYALHHVRTRVAKAGLYRRVGAALRRGGVFVSVDCHPATNRTLARRQRELWRAHLRKTYGRADADAFLAAWAKEDVYVPLADEIDLIEQGGLAADVIWRKGSFAVLSASPRG